MVDITAVRQSNSQYASAERTGLVCVFAGATGGIGHATLQAMATLLKDSTFYILGRGQSRHESKLDHLKNISPSCKFIFIETQVSLISEIDNACKIIASAEEKVDYLCMSPGGMPFQGAVCKYASLQYRRF
jgi:NADP-dependent 3-hydroxy acid dehydrogenase YdfG